MVIHSANRREKIKFLYGGGTNICSEQIEGARMGSDIGVAVIIRDKAIEM